MVCPALRARYITRYITERSSLLHSVLKFTVLGGFSAGGRNRMPGSFSHLTDEAGRIKYWTHGKGWRKISQRSKSVIAITTPDKFRLSCRLRRLSFAWQLLQPRIMSSFSTLILRTGNHQYRIIKGNHQYRITETILHCVQKNTHFCFLA